MSQAKPTKYQLTISDLARVTGKTYSEISQYFAAENLVILPGGRMAIPSKEVRRFLSNQGYDYKNQVISHINLSGNHKHKDTVVIRFSDLQSLKDWHSSPEYQSLIPIREIAADIDLLVFEE